MITEIFIILQAETEGIQNSHKMGHRRGYTLGVFYNWL